MSKLTYAQRQRLHPQSFALEKERKYPLNDISHARNALARVSAFGTKAEKQEVRREVYAKYPELRKERVRRIIIKPVKPRMIIVNRGLTKAQIRRLGL